MDCAKELDFGVVCCGYAWEVSAISRDILGALVGVSN